MVENTVIFNIQGRHGLGNLAAFVDQATQALAISPFLIVNLARAEFFDSSAMGALVALAIGRARPAVVYDWSRSRRRLHAYCSLVRLDRFFDIDDDVETSLKSCRISSATWVAPEQDHQGWVVLKMPRSLDANTVPELIEHVLREWPKMRG